MVQAAWRPVMARRAAAAARIQAAVRARQGRRRFLLMRESAVKLQVWPLPITPELS